MNKIKSIFTKSFILTSILILIVTLVPISTQITIETQKAKALTGFDYTMPFSVTNNLGESRTDPVIPIHIIPYSSILYGSWTVDSNSYNYRIPIDVTETSNSALAHYPVKIWPIDTEWLKDNNWATSTGNEIRFTEDDGSTLLDFFLEPNSGWDAKDTCYWVDMSMTALEETTIYMYCDPDLTAVSSASSSSDMITAGSFGLYEDFSGGTNFSYTNKLGDDFASSNSVGADSLLAMGYTASETVTIDGFKVKCGTNGNLKVALYSDTGSDKPNVAVAQSVAYAVSDGAGTYYIPFTSSYEIQNGTKYWFVFISDTTNTRRRAGTSTGDCKYYISYGYSNFTFQDLSGLTWGGSNNNENCIDAGILVEAALTGWTVNNNTDSSLFSGGDLTLSGSQSILSDSQYSTDKAVRMYLDHNNTDSFNLGFISSSGEVYAKFFVTSLYDQMIGCDNGVAATNINNQYPYPQDEFAMYEVMRRASGTNKSSWAQFEANNIMLTDAPITTNVPPGSLPIKLGTASSGTIDCKWLIVRDYVSPEPLVRIPQIHHHPDTLFLQDLCENWPYDIAFNEQGSTNELYYWVDDETVSSEYGATFYILYDGTITNSATADLEISFGKASQTSWSNYADDAGDVFSFYDEFDIDSAWEEDTGSWAVDEQQRPLITDYHLMNAYPDVSAHWEGGNAWQDNNGDWRYITFASSWEGTNSNNQGEVQWPDPWHLLLWIKKGDYWYCQGNVVRVEFDGAEKGVLPYSIWEGDDAELGDADWLYMICGVTWRASYDGGALGSGDNTSFILVNKDKTGETWKVLNNGAPIFDYNSIGGVSTDNLRFTQLLWDDVNEEYLGPYGNMTTTPQYGRYVYTNGGGYAADIEGVLYETDTFDASNWTNGGTIVDCGSGSTEYLFFVYNTNTSSWFAMTESYIPADDRNFWYWNCTGTFEAGMDSSDWGSRATITDLDVVYEWSRFNQSVESPSIIDSVPTLFYQGHSENNFLKTSRVATATNSYMQPTGWTPTRLDNYYYQSTDVASWQTAHIDGTNLTQGMIETSVVLQGDSANDKAGIIWEFDEESNTNFWFWGVDETNDGFSYGYVDNGGSYVLTNTYDPSTIYDDDPIWHGEEYRLRVIFDGTTVTLQYSRLGWEWITAFENITCSQLTGYTTSEVGLATYDAEAYFDNFRTYSDWVISPSDIDYQFSIDSEPAYLDISVSPSTWAIGTIGLDETKNTGLDNYTLTNNALLLTDVTIEATNMTGIGVTWTLSSDGSNGDAIYGLKAGLSGGSYNIVVKPSSPNYLKQSLAALGTQDFGLEIYAPDQNIGQVAMSGTVTLTASLHT